MKSKQPKQPLYTDNRAYIWLLVYALATLFSGKWTFFLASWIGPVFGLRFLRSKKTGRGILLFLIATYIPVVFPGMG